jgi:multidrug resistance efflux pump
MSAFFDFETPMADLKGVVGLLAHLSSSDREIQGDVLAHIQHLAHRAYDDLESSCADAQREVEALKAEIDKLKHAIKPPGCAADVAQAKAYWQLLDSAGRTVLAACKGART